MRLARCLVALPALLLVLLLLGLSHGTVRRPVTPVRSGTLPAPSGQRVFAKVSDFRFDNPEVTAIVRATDGALVDFLRKGVVLSTSDALGATTHLDALWQLVPVVLVNGAPIPRPSSNRVSALPGRVRVEGTFRKDALVVDFRIDYALDPEHPRLLIVTEFSSAAPLPGWFEAGVEVRWGNAAYSVDWYPEPLMSFEGLARWVGRRGAGGDLLLRGVSPPVYGARFASKERGFVPALRALHPASDSDPRRVSGSFELSYEALPPPPHARSTPPPTGELALEVRDERGRPLPSKLGVWKVGDQDPPFPALGGLDGADRFVWTGNGRITRALPAGDYDLVASAGPERSLFRRRIRIQPGKVVRDQIVLRRVVSTPGFIAADLHLHQAPSVDADLSLEARLISIAAEGVEFAVASDHYVVTDYAPTVNALVDSGALARPIVTVAGSEVSPVGNRFGHFNVFPLPHGAEVEYENTTPGRLFASARRASPNGVLQVNHPRHDPELGYFLAYGFDRATGATSVPGYDPGFDALEVFNGFHVHDQPFTDGLLKDYLRLLGTGKRYVATGSSDSHQLAFLDPGLPRTLIAYGGADDEADRTAAPSAVLAALKAGRAIVTSGPIIEASVGGAGPGETAHHVGKRAALKVRVRAAPWVSTRIVSVLEGPSGRVLERIAIEKSQAITRFERTLPIELSGPTFVVVTALGDTPLPNTSRADIVPFAFTNPIWLEP